MMIIIIIIKVIIIIKAIVKVTIIIKTLRQSPSTRASNKTNDEQIIRKKLNLLRKCAHELVKYKLKKTNVLFR